MNKHRKISRWFLIILGIAFLSLLFTNFLSPKKILGVSDSRIRNFDFESGDFTDWFEADPIDRVDIIQGGPPGSDYAVRMWGDDKSGKTYIEQNLSPPVKVEEFSMYIATDYAHANLELTLTYSDNTAESYVSDAQIDRWVGRGWVKKTWGATHFPSLDTKQVKTVRITNFIDHLQHATDIGSVILIGEGGIPIHLFDISLEVDDITIDRLADLTARVIFVSFGTEPTPVDLTFTVIDKDNQEVYQDKKHLVVETEVVFVKNFKDVTLDLKPGPYTLVLKTLYNTDVEDEFSQEFEITSTVSLANLIKSPVVWVLLAITFSFTSGVFITAIYFKKFKNEKKFNLPKPKSVASSLPNHNIHNN